MSSKSDLLSDNELDHYDDRVYMDCLDRTFNIEVNKNSPAFVYFNGPNENDGDDGYVLFSIKEDSKLFKNLVKYFRGNGKYGFNVKDLDK